MTALPFCADVIYGRLPNPLPHSSLVKSVDCTKHLRTLSDRDRSRPPMPDACTLLTINPLFALGVRSLSMERASEKRREELPPIREDGVGGPVRFVTVPMEMESVRDRARLAISSSIGSAILKNRGFYDGCYNKRMSCVSVCHTYTATSIMID